MILQPSLPHRGGISCAPAVGYRGRQIDPPLAPGPHASAFASCTTSSPSTDSACFTSTAQTIALSTGVSWLRVKPAPPLPNAMCQRRSLWVVMGSREYHPRRWDCVFIIREALWNWDNASHQVRAEPEGLIHGSDSRVVNRPPACCPGLAISARRAVGKRSPLFSSAPVTGDWLEQPHRAKTHVMLKASTCAISQAQWATLRRWLERVIIVPPPPGNLSPIPSWFREKAGVPRK